MMNAQMAEEGVGVRAARAHRAKRRRVVLLGLAGALGIGAITSGGRYAGGNIPGHMPAQWAVAAVVAMVLLLLLTIRFWDRATDELDRMDTLRANSFGLYFYLAATWCWLVLNSGGIGPQINPLWLLIATLCATLGRYFQLKLAHR